MKSFYFDTSALVKLYVEEAGSDAVLQIAEDREKNQLVMLELSRIELRSAVRQRQRNGDIEEANAAAILRQFEQDSAAAYVIQLDTNVMQEAARLLDKHPIKGQEALQLAGCLVACTSVPPPVTLVCADSDLCDSARQEGFRVLNPVQDGPQTKTA